MYISILPKNHAGSVEMVISDQSQKLFILLSFKSYLSNFLFTKQSIPFFLTAVAMENQNKNFK